MVNATVVLSLINILFLNVGLSHAHAFCRSSLQHADSQKDSVYYILVKQIASAMERKIKRERQFFDEITPNAAGVKKQNSSDSGIMQHKKGIKDPYVLYSGKPSLFQAGIADEIPMESLINLPYGQLDSIRMLMDKTPQARAIYGNRMDVGILTLFPKTRSRKLCKHCGSTPTANRIGEIITNG